MKTAPTAQVNEPMVDHKWGDILMVASIPTVLICIVLIAVGQWDAVEGTVRTIARATAATVLVLFGIAITASIIETMRKSVAAEPHRNGGATKTKTRQAGGADEYYREQEDLPGGPIGAGTATSNGHTLWRHPSGAANRVDAKLERTTLRWHDGWYILTSLENSRIVLRREGPFEGLRAMETALARTATGKALASDAWNAVDDEVQARMDTITREGLTQRIRETAQEWPGIGEERPERPGATGFAALQEAMTVYQWWQEIAANRPQRCAPSARSAAESG